MVASDSIEEIEKSPNFDVYRTIVLGHYMHYWGAPRYRHVIQIQPDQPVIEMYAFPPTSSTQPYRIASLGLAEKIKADGEREGKEYFMVLPDDLGGADLEEVFTYFASIAVHIVKNVRRSCHLPRLLGPSPLAPARWTTKALLIDEATGECEDFGTAQLGDKVEIEIEWLIPLTEAEYKFILEKGIDPFDDLVQTYEESLVDVNRAGLVKPH